MDVNWSQALQEINNVSKLNWTFNVTNYPAINNLTHLNTSNVTSFFNGFMTPITAVWVANLHEWFYVLLIYFTVGVVYIKSRSVFPTALVLLFMSIAVMLGVAVTLPVKVALYVSLGLALTGVLYGLLVGRSYW